MIDSFLDILFTLFKCGMGIVILLAPVYADYKNSCASRQCNFFNDSELMDLLDDEEKKENSLKKKKKQPKGLSKKDRKIIEKYIDDGYKRMKR